MKINFKTMPYTEIRKARQNRRILSTVTEFNEDVIELNAYFKNSNIFFAIFHIVFIIVFYNTLRQFFKNPMAVFNSIGLSSCILQMIIMVVAGIMIILVAISIIRTFLTFYRVITSYAQYKNMICPRINYRKIQNLKRVMDDKFEFFRYYNYMSDAYDEESKEYYNTSVNRFVVTYDGEDVCSTFWTYLIMGCGLIRCRWSKSIESIAKKFGIAYFANHQTEREFNKKVNQSTQKLIEKMMNDINDMKLESAELIKKGANQEVD